jgi:hypothetical protein
MKQKLILALLALLPVFAFAEKKGVIHNGIYFIVYDDGTAHVTWNPERYSGDVVIPASFTFEDKEYHTVSITDYAFYDCYDLTSVSLPYGLGIIGPMAFQYCVQLEEITIPETVNTIAAGAFADCISLTKFNLPKQLVNIGEGAFYGCPHISTLTLPRTVQFIGAQAFDKCFIETLFVNNVFTLSSGDVLPFSDETFDHAMLYVPEGMWREAVYASAYWRYFTNIREATVKTTSLQMAKPYMMLNAQTHRHLGYEGGNELNANKAFYTFDESDSDLCWQLVEEGGNKYLYNIGAKKFATVNDAGEIELSYQAQPINLEQAEDGVKIGNDTYFFVANSQVKADDNATVIKGISMQPEEDADAVWYTLDGRKLNDAPAIKGVYLHNGKKVTVK